MGVPLRTGRGPALGAIMRSGLIALAAVVLGVVVALAIVVAT